MVRLIGPTGTESRKPLRKPVRAATTVGGSSAIRGSGCEFSKSEPRALSPRTEQKRETPHPSPLPFGRGEGESSAVLLRKWVRGKPRRLFDVHWDHEPATGALPLLLWRRGLGRGGLVSSSTQSVHGEGSPSGSSSSSSSSISRRIRPEMRGRMKP